MKTKLKSGDILSKDGLAKVKGGDGDDRDYVIVIDDGQSIRTCIYSYAQLLYYGY
ncbi:hypothetical protein [Marinifilum sp.]|uniref:hypothetical protein n=1 Tax=Marinifilum sp. TaxID=2033137 RepID=UPI003BA9B095